MTTTAIIKPVVMMLRTVATTVHGDAIPLAWVMASVILLVITLNADSMKGIVSSVPRDALIDGLGISCAIRLVMLKLASLIWEIVKNVHPDVSFPS